MTPVATPVSDKVREIKIAHSPDSDDAFMFYGLATNKVRVPGYKFAHTLTDIEALNHRAMTDQFYDVTAISFHAYPYIQENYTLMPCGGSVGDSYGPMIVARQPWTIDGVLPTFLSVSDLPASSVALSLAAFVLFYSVLLVVEILLMVRAIRQGPAAHAQPAAIVA